MNVNVIFLKEMIEIINVSGWRELYSGWPPAGLFIKFQEYEPKRCWNYGET